VRRLEETQAKREDETEESGEIVVEKNLFHKLVKSTGTFVSGSSGRYVEDGEEFSGQFEPFEIDLTELQSTDLTDTEGGRDAASDFEGEEEGEEAEKQQPPSTGREMYSRSGSSAGSIGSTPRETDSLLASGGGDSASLTSYNDVNAEYLFPRDSRTPALAQYPQPDKWTICCGLFSFFGILYLTFLGIYAKQGNMYLAHPWPPHLKNVVARNAFLAACLYAGCLVTAVHRYKKQARYHGYAPGRRNGAIGSFRDLDD